MESESHIEKDDGILFLVGLSSTDVGNAFVLEDDSPATASSNGLIDETKRHGGTNSVGKSSNTELGLRLPQVNGSETHHGMELSGHMSQLLERTAFSYAFKCTGYCTPNGKVEPPPVTIKDFSVLGKGFALVANRRIAKNEVIYTERAALATQIPVLQKLSGDSGQHSPFLVRACQNCFRSLEPISSCELYSIDSSHKLPSSYLWPVQDLKFDGNNNRSDGLKCDDCGRLWCEDCGSLFCSDSCLKKFRKQLGSCCAIISILRAVSNLLSTQEVDTEAAVILATRMFVASLLLYRGSEEEWRRGTFLDGLCGEASDVNALQLGEPLKGKDGSTHYCLSSVYELLCEEYQCSIFERRTFSLELFHRFASVGARNGFDVSTESPFRSYYQALLRSLGGRGSSKHELAKRQVALALGSTNGTLERDMDHKVEQVVAVQVAALFVLTARINHSCCPNAEIRSQQFVDCHVDLVAKEDISAGEEITICYIAGARHRRNKRRRELQVKYMFLCDCVRCHKEQD